MWVVLQGLSLNVINSERQKTPKGGEKKAADVSRTLPPREVPNTSPFREEGKGPPCGLFSLKPAKKKPEAEMEGEEEGFEEERRILSHRHLFPTIREGGTVLGLIICEKRRVFFGRKIYKTRKNTPSSQAESWGKEEKEIP